MVGALPPVVVRLLNASEPIARDSAWADFVSAYSRLIYHASRGHRGDYDRVMNCYAYVLEQLRRDDFHRLRMFATDGRSEFTTWLVVVAQRLCLDQQRAHYGRQRVADGDSATRAEEWASRRRLVDLVSAEIDLTLLHDHVVNAEESVRLAEIYGALEGALTQLPARDRLLVKLRFEDELPMPVIARDLGFTNRFHAYRHLERVLRELRQALAKHGIVDTVP